MNIKSFSNKLILGTGLLVLTGCKEVKHEVSKCSKLPIVELVDSFVKSPINSVDTAGFEMFCVDTLEISKELLQKPKKYIEKIQKIARYKAPEVDLGPELTFGFGWKVDGGIGQGIVIQNKMVRKYDPKTLQIQFQNKVYANEDSTRYFVPVNYYGKLNPEALSK